MYLYFGDVISTTSTLLVIGAFIYIGMIVSIHKKINNWGRKIAILVTWGLVICCFVAIRDGYHLSVQASMDKNVTAGLFTLKSIQSTLCSIGGGIIAFCSLSSIFIRKQNYRKIMFMILLATILLKTLIIEISRLLM